MHFIVSAVGTMLNYTEFCMELKIFLSLYTSTEKCLYNINELTTSVFGMFLMHFINCLHCDCELLHYFAL